MSKFGFRLFRQPKPRPYSPRFKTGKWSCPLKNRCFCCPTNSLWTPVPISALDRQSMQCVWRKMAKSSFVLWPTETFMECTSRECHCLICKTYNKLIYNEIVNSSYPFLFCSSIAENDIATNGQRTFIGITQVNGSYFLGCSTGNMYR